jgi:hypothetical protein
LPHAPQGLGVLLFRGLFRLSELSYTPRGPE